MNNNFLLSHVEAVLQTINMTCMEEVEQVSPTQVYPDRPRAFCQISMQMHPEYVAQSIVAWLDPLLYDVSFTKLPAENMYLLTVEYPISILH